MTSYPSYPSHPSPSGPTQGPTHGRTPLIGLTCDADAERIFLRHPYIEAIHRAGGVPLPLPPQAALADEYVDLCDAIVLTGGDDPRMEAFGTPTHPKATPVTEARQAFELAVLEALARRREMPALGICLGMQFMALHAGGTLDQHLPATLSSHERHWGRVAHEVGVDLLGRTHRATVLSHHRQAVRDPGALKVAGRSDDGVIECVIDPSRAFYVGVQWHPERTADAALGAGLLEALVQAAREASRRG